MILPTRHLSPSQSLIGLAAIVVKTLDRPRTVNQLWESLRSDQRIGTFDRFVLALDLLFMLGMVDMEDGELRVAR